MKKCLLTAFFLLAMLATLVACGGNAPAETTAASPAETEDDMTIPAETTVASDNAAAALQIAELVDFVLPVEAGRDVRILQLTDLQIIDPGQSRYPERLNGNPSPLTDEDIRRDCFDYIEKAVAEVEPDLIIVTGDLVYGEFDDSGEIFEKVIAFFEKLGIPWAPVFGNHDNESTKGVTWQCEQLEAAEHCLFRRGELTGNGNYSIGILQDGKLIKAIYMMDSNGCGYAYDYGFDPSFGSYNQGEKVKTNAGFGSDQTRWLSSSAKKIDATLGYTVSKMAAFHIPIAEFADAAYAAGYQDSAELSNSQTYVIGQTVEAQNGDFGTKGEAFKGIFDQTRLWRILKDNHFDGVFVGHSHLNNVSILYDGIRLTFGLKTGTYDRYNAAELGGTAIILSDGGETMTVRHVYVEGPK